MVEAGFDGPVEPIGYRRACGGRGTKVEVTLNSFPSASHAKRDKREREFKDIRICSEHTRFIMISFHFALAFSSRLRNSVRFLGDRREDRMIQMPESVKG